MNIPRLTRESARTHNACYSDKRIACLVPPGGLTPSQIARLTISHEDRLWALYTLADDRILREHACWCARQALALILDPDPRSIAAVDVAERFARGEATTDELDAAWSAARAAARDAAWDAARDAAWAAARAAARDAAWDAAWAAAWDAARAAAWDDAAWDAARDAARDAQISHLVARLTPTLAERGLSVSRASPDLLVPTAYQEPVLQ
jgi:hypothetical protein